MLYRASENAEIILEKGVIICNTYTDKLEESKQTNSNWYQKSQTSNIRMHITFDDLFYPYKKFG